MPTLPFKLNQDRRRHIPEQKRRVTNWREYDESLRRRGSLTVWVSEQAGGGGGGAPPPPRAGPPPPPRPPRPRASPPPGRLPPRWYAIPASSASIIAGRAPGRAASILGANATPACFAPLKLTSRGSMPTPAAAMA